MHGTLAIDLGSSTTVVAYQPPDQPARLLPLPPYSLDQPCVVPSLLWLSSADASKPLLGRQVLEAGLGFDNSPRLQRDFKRQIGAGGHHSNGCSAATTLPLPPETAAERLLLGIWQALPTELEPSRLVLTAPIESYAGYRQWLLQLAQQLAVPEIALVDEPTAAAIGCGLAPGSRVLVVDLGGGTTDLSLVQIPGGQGRAAPVAQLLRLGGRLLENSRQTLRCAKVLGKAGLALGGRDIDRWIAADLCPGEPLQGALLAHAETLKCQLSDQDQARTLWAHSDGTLRELRLDRDQLTALLLQQGLISQLDTLLEAVLAQGRANGISLEQIDAVLPVGGSSQLAVVQQWLRQRLDPIPLRNQRPVEAVALGALALTPGVQVRDVLNRGVSLRCWDQRSGAHRWHPLYVAGQHWPTDQELEVVLASSREGQAALELVLGEPQEAHRAEVIYANGLPQLRQRDAGAPAVIPWSQQPQAIDLDPPGIQGQDRLRLRFSIDAQADLIVSVEDLQAPTRPARQRRLGAVR